MLLLLAAIFLGGLYCWYLYEYRRLNDPLKSLPGPKGSVLLGNAADFASTEVILQRLIEYSKRYGKTFKVRFGPFLPLIVTSDAKAVEFFLGHPTEITKSRNYTFLHRWLGNGLLTSTGGVWRRRRKIITPTFHFKILEDFIDVFNSCSSVMITKLRNEVGKDSVDIWPFISLCALDVICETAMGTKVNAQDDSESDYVSSVKTMCWLIIVRSFSAYKLYDPLYKLTSDYKKEVASLKILHGFTEAVINRKFKELKTDQSEEETDELGRKKKMAFLDLLIKASNASENPLTGTEIREEVDTFMFEGHDTTAAAMSFLIYALANHPDIQMKILEELDQIFEGDRKRPATFKDLQEMKYLEMAIKEGLRLYPSVPFYARDMMNDVSFNGVTIPKGASVVVFAHQIHRDPDYFPQPEKFDPDRFLPTEQQTSPYVYIPFSAGPRNCIGQKFAMLEMKSLISKVLRNFEILPAIPEHKLELTSETILKSITGIRVKLKARI